MTVMHIVDGNGDAAVQSADATPTRPNSFSVEAEDLFHRVIVSAAELNKFFMDSS